LAVVLGILPLALLELGLCALGIGDPAVIDLHAGFGNSARLFELDRNKQFYRTRLASQRFFVEQEFPAVKSPTDFRIFCLGGSTVQGRPYRPDSAFGQWLELQLNAADPSRRYQTINCGGISYASYRLRSLLQEVLTYEPDLIILATGHNEFLEDQTYADVKNRSGLRLRLEEFARSLRTVSLLRKLTGGEVRQEPTEDSDESSGPSTEAVEARLDDEAGYASYHRDEEWQQQVSDSFGSSVRSMVQMCQKPEVPIVLVQLGANLRDCPPFKSEHRADIDVADEQQWQTLFDNAAANAVADPAAALALYQRAAKIDDQFPLLNFRIGRCQDRLGLFNEARQSYLLARDQDICPLRMPGNLAENLMVIARETQVPIIDAAASIADRSPQQIPGFNAFVDHVHPTIGGHQRMAQAIAAALQQADIVASSQVAAEQLRRLYRDHMKSLGPVYFSNGRRRIGWLENWAQRQRLLDEITPVDARGMVAATIRSLDLHNFQSATESLHDAVATDEAARKMLLEHSVELFRQGRTHTSRWVLEELAEGARDDASTSQLASGFLIVAIDEEDISEAAAVYKRHAENWDAIIETDTSGWSQTMPDVLERMRKLLP
jgi:lysophospholipase L1-like esterase